MNYSVGEVEYQIQSWLENVVIGLNLCPFANKPYSDGRVRIIAELTEQYDEILERVLGELRFLENDKEKKVETTLVALPNALTKFEDYLSCLSDVNELLFNENYEGIFQIASFHPEYRFEGTDAEDLSNLTNRSPFPVFHIIREETLERIIDNVEDVDAIPERNIKLMSTMNKSRLTSLFPWLFEKTSK